REEFKNRTKTNKASMMLALVTIAILASILVVFSTNSSNNPTGEQNSSQGKQENLIDPSEIVSGGVPKDGIPSIDSPKFVSADEADKWLDDDELVLALSYKGVNRVYPLQIMVWHEIVNDVVAGDPILVTYCPLCGSGIAYKREIDGEAVEFGVSGKLYNSNLVMYDRKTNTYWTQIDGKAVVGELAGKELEPVSIDTTTWGEWKRAHPDSEVLSRETGYSRPYGHDPYGNYYTSNSLLFNVGKTDNTIHPKTVVFGVEVNGHYKAYKEQDLKQQPEIIDEIGGVRIKIERENDGKVRVTNLATGKEIVKERDFWFAWYAFHPDTELYNGSTSASE
ncbi:DUF3179 domain-containing protein, partial [Candidatus Pacearchaeota archaeon]